MDLIMEGKDTSGLYYKGKQYTTTGAFKIRGTSSRSFKTYASRSSAGNTKENFRMTFSLRIGQNNRFSLYTYNTLTKKYTAVTTVPTNYYLAIRGPVVNQVVVSPTSNIVLKQYSEGTNSFYFAYRTGTTPNYTTYTIINTIIYGKNSSVVTDHYAVLATTSAANVFVDNLYFMSGASFTGICYRDSSRLADASTAHTYYTATFNAAGKTHTRTKYSNLLTLPISINTNVSNFCPTLYSPCITNATNTEYTATLI